MDAVTIIDGSARMAGAPGSGAWYKRGAGRGARRPGLNGADRCRSPASIRAAGVPADIPGMELAGEVVASGPERRASSRRSRDGGRRRWWPGRDGGRSRTAPHPGAGRVDLGRSRWVPRGVHDRSRRALHPVRPQCGRAGLRARRRRRRRHRRCAAGRRRRSGGGGDRADKELREAVSDFGATAVACEDFVDHGPFDVVLELVGAPNLPDDMRSLVIGGRVVVIGVGAGAKAELNLLELMGQAGSHPRFDTAAAEPGGEGSGRSAGRAPGAAAAGIRTGAGAGGGDVPDGRCRADTRFRRRRQARQGRPRRPHA